MLGRLGPHVAEKDLLGLGLLGSLHFLIFIMSVGESPASQSVSTQNNIPEFEFEWRFYALSVTQDMAGDSKAFDGL